MTLADILNEIKRCLKEPSTGGHWSDNELLLRINIAQRKIASITGCIKGTNTMLSISGMQEYSKPKYIINIIRVKYDNKRIFGIPIDDLDLYNPNWTLHTGTPTNYYETNTSIGLYPKPNENDKIISLEYTKLPNDLSNLSDIPFDNMPYLYDYHDLIVDFVVWKCLLEDQNQFYAEYKSNFNNGISFLKNSIKFKPDEFRTGNILRKQSYGNGKPLPFMW